MRKVNGCDVTTKTRAISASVRTKEMRSYNPPSGGQDRTSAKKWSRSGENGLASVSTKGNCNLAQDFLHLCPLHRGYHARGAKKTMEFCVSKFYGIMSLQMLRLPLQSATMPKTCVRFIQSACDTCIALWKPPNRPALCKTIAILKLTALYAIVQGTVVYERAKQHRQQGNCLDLCGTMCGFIPGSLIICVPGLCQEQKIASWTRRPSPWRPWSHLYSPRTSRRQRTRTCPSLPESRACKTTSSSYQPITTQISTRLL